PYIIIKDGKEYVEANMQKMYAATSEVMFFGETHGDPSTTKSLIFYLDDLKKAGFNAIALECYANLQPSIDKFMAMEDPSKAEDLLYDTFLPYYSAGVYSKILLSMAAKKSNTPLFCIDMPATEFPETLTDIASFLPKRDAWMEKRVLELLDKYGKVAVLCGRAHASFLSKQVIDFGDGITTTINPLAYRLGMRGIPVYSLDFPYSFTQFRARVE
ncbi:MAG: hypothetical protein D6769_02030, partial [Methanobacteriota archaeon]